MKRELFFSIFALPAMLSFSSMHGQTNNLNGETLVKSVSNSTDADKLALETIKMTNERMYGDFGKRFKNASDIHFSQSDNRHFISCYTNGDLNRAMYNKKGKWLHTVTTYDNSKLPESVRDLIEYSYPRYTIFGGVIEVNVSNKKAFLVTIENKNGWKRIKVVDDESEVYEEHQNSK